MTDDEIQRLIEQSHTENRKHCHSEFEVLDDKLGRLIMLLDGDPQRDVVGMRKRLRDVESYTASIAADLANQKAERLKEREAWENQWKGIAFTLKVERWLLTLVGVTGVGSFLAIMADILRWVHR